MDEVTLPDYETAATVQPASAADLPWLQGKDPFLDPQVLTLKVQRGEYLVATAVDESVGFLRFSHLFSVIPFIDLIRVDPKHQRRGVGRMLLAHFEKMARSSGRTVIMSSSQSDEIEPQEWHRHVGFSVAGEIMDLRPLQDVPEVLFRKELT